VVREAVGEHLLVLALGANEQRDEQSDATAVHVVEPGDDLLSRHPLGTGH
jgi:hypothetical protein